MNEKAITLPNREEMLARLLKIDDDQHLQGFYQILLDKAGQERTASGIVLMLTLAISAYAKGMSSMPSVMYMLAPDFIDALVSDPEMAEEAKNFLQKALS